MLATDCIATECRTALGCTEPAAIAYAASKAAALVDGEVVRVRLICDARVFKNCYAVGIPYSDHKIGIRWAAAIGAFLPDPELRLESFRQITPEVLASAQRLLDAGAARVEIDRSKHSLFLDCLVERTGGSGRAIIERDHTHLVKLERNGAAIPLAVDKPRAEGSDVRAWLAERSFAELIQLARSLPPEDRLVLRRGCEMNLALARHGLKLFPASFVDMAKEDSLTRISRSVCAGVYARMWGEDFPVMSVAGSGNKGIVCAVPLASWGLERNSTQEQIDEALALAILVTSSTTHFLGTLSAVCGCSNAAGIGLAAGLCLLEGGDVKEISLAINNMVGNVTGMICDGAKIGCALKTMTAVDSAFRSTRLALCGIGIPPSDGIVGGDGMASLRNLGRIANQGMTWTDNEILAIMQEKLG
jgi:L-cysteine desulfidase